MDVIPLGSSVAGEPLELLAIIDAIPALVVCALPDGTVEFVNQSWREYAGASSANQKDWGWDSLLHGEDQRNVVASCAAARATGKIFEVEARLRRADGQYSWFLIRELPQLDPGGQIIRWYGTAYDIDARKRADEKLRNNEAELRTIIETIPAFVGTALPDGSVDFVSQSWLDYTGLTREQWLDWGWMTVTLCAPGRILAISVQAAARCLSPICSNCPASP